MRFLIVSLLSSVLVLAAGEGGQGHGQHREHGHASKHADNKHQKQHKASHHKKPNKDSNKHTKHVETPSNMQLAGLQAKATGNVLHQIDDSANGSIDTMTNTSEQIVLKDTSPLQADSEEHLVKAAEEEQHTAEREETDSGERLMTKHEVTALYIQSSKEAVNVQGLAPYTQGACAAEESTQKTPANQCKFQYYMIEMMETADKYVAKWSLAELRLYYHGKNGLRTFPSSEITTRLVDRSNRTLAACHDEVVDRLFDGNVDTKFCADQKAYLMMNLGEPVAVSVYTFMSGVVDRKFDPKSWKFYGLQVDHPMGGRVLLSTTSSVTFPQSKYMCDPPWYAVNEQQTCFTTTSTTTTTTTTTTTITRDPAATCTFQYYCLQVHSSFENLPDWKLAEIEFRLNGTAADIAPDRSGAFFAGANPLVAASLKHDGTEAYLAVDGDLTTIASLKAPPSGEASLCVSIPKKSPVNEYILAFVGKGSPQKWSVFASDDFDASLDQWANVSASNISNYAAPTPDKITMERAPLNC